MAELILDDDAIEKAVQAAILSAISPERRDQMIEHAIKDLLAVTQEEGYGSTKRTVSKIQLCFERAVYSYAHDIVKKTLASEKYTNLISEIVEEAFQKVAGENRPEVVVAIAETFASAVSQGFKDRY